jgi:hypothetical protein
MTVPDPLPPLPPVIDPAAVRPTVDDVALLLRTRTVGGQAQGGLGADTGPGDVTTFTDDTRPTAIEADAVIGHAVDEVLGFLPARADAQYLPAILRTIAIRAASVIEISFFRETTDTGAAAPLNTAYTADLQALQRAIPGDPEAFTAAGLSEREQDILAAAQ